MQAHSDPVRTSASPRSPKPLKLGVLPHAIRAWGAGCSARLGEAATWSAIGTLLLPLAIGIALQPASATTVTTTGSNGTTGTAGTDPGGDGGVGGNGQAANATNPAKVDTSGQFIDKGLARALNQDAWASANTGAGNFLRNLGGSAAGNIDQPGSGGAGCGCAK